MRTFSPGLAARLGHAKRPREMASALPPLIMGNELAESILSYVEELKQGPPIFLSLHRGGRTAGVGMGNS